MVKTCDLRFPKNFTNPVTLDNNPEQIWRVTGCEELSVQEQFALCSGCQLRQLCIWPLQPHTLYTHHLPEQTSSRIRVGSKVRLVRDRLRTKQFFRSNRIRGLYQPQWASAGSLMHPGGAEGTSLPPGSSSSVHPDDSPPVPTFDIAGCLRGQCLSCSECPAYICLSGRVLCDYCGCPPARHVSSVFLFS